MPRRHPREDDLLQVHSCRRARDEIRVDLATSSLPPDAVWIDALDPSEDEAAFIQRATGLTLPNLAQLSEVESSSRLRSDENALYLSLPVVSRARAGEARTTPVGLILSADHLVTVRFEALKSFDAFGERVERGEFPHPTTIGIFVALLEAVVDRLADILEEVGGDLDEVATRIFGGHDAPTRTSKGSKAEDAKLRATLKQVGRDRQLISKARATLLGIGRIVPYVEGQGRDWLPPDAKPRLDTLKQDIASLDEYEVHLSDKVQFLLDAALGLISIEQNDTFRVLTIVSVVGIPPTLVASMYGMNFKNMPELNWTYGYAYGLALIAASALIPLLYFKGRGWF